MMSKVFLPVKSNLSQPVKGLKYRIISVDLKGGISTSCIEWLGETDKDAFDVLAPRVTTQKDRPAIDGAEDWLNEILKEKPVKALDVKAAAKECPYSWSTIRRAAIELKIKPKRRGFGYGSKWWWMTEEQAAKPEYPDEQVQTEVDQEDAQTKEPKK
jgi:hypothetical protein